MAILPEFLPNELHYIIPLAERHGGDARVALYDHRLGRHVQYAERLSADEIVPLRQLYAEISTKGHGPLINRWYWEHNCEDTCPNETTWPVYGLLFLFAQLAELDIEPFNDWAVCLEEKKDTELLDWSKLPPSLRYLAEPAERYGRIQFDDRIDEFLQEQMTPDEKVELQALVQRYEQDWKPINQWLNEFRMTEHSEARLVYFTGHLLGTGCDMGLW